MAISKQVLVEVPDDKGVHIKTSGVNREKYVYKYVKYFRNSDGKPRNKSKAIGKYDQASGKMYPNNNYFEMYQIDPINPGSTVMDYGYSYIALKACEETGLINCLRTAFGERAMEIIVMASYIIREGNAMDGIDDWQQRNYFPTFNNLINSQISSRIFASITDEQTDIFFNNWIATAHKGGSVCYDVTSVSSYSREMIEIERGYNRDGDDLAQYNLGMFCNEATKMPLYYNRYNGSLTDKANLSYVLENASSVGIKNVKMILDGGFWSEECMNSLYECCDTFTVGMPAYLKESEKVISLYGDGIDKYSNKLADCHHIYCKQIESKIYGIDGRILLYYDSLNHTNLCDELSDRIELLKAELSTLKRFPKSKLKRYSSYFEITKHDNDSGFDYSVDENKVELLRKNKGFFLLFTTDMDSTASDILSYYRAKDADEKIFSQIKVDMDCGRLRTHNSEIADGKTFVTFIACVIRSYMLGKLSVYLNKNSTSMKKVFNQLSNIMIASSPAGRRFTKALTKKQKEILSVFEAEDDIIKSLNDSYM